MFTVEQIKEAHGKVRSGADFPAYIKEINSLGVTYYETYVMDGHTDYFGANGFKISTTAKYDRLAVTKKTSVAEFKANLKAHQEGKTDYLTFCNDCARAGIEKWAVCMEEMTCTYFDQAGNKLLIEAISRL